MKIRKEQEEKMFLEYMVCLEEEDTNTNAVSNYYCSMPLNSSPFLRCDRIKIVMKIRNIETTVESIRQAEKFEEGTMSVILDHRGD